MESNYNPIISVLLYGYYVTLENYIILGLFPLHALLHVPFSVGNHLLRGLDLVTHTRWRKADIIATHVSSFMLCIALGYCVFSVEVFCALVLVQFCTCSYLIYQECIGEEQGWNRMMKTVLVGIEVVIYLFPIFYQGYKITLVIPGVLLVGGIVYSTGIPERFWPGKFDYVGHGNQIMHVMLLLAHIMEMFFVLEKCTSRV